MRRSITSTFGANDVEPRQSLPPAGLGGMRVAIVGSGGAGKSVVCGTLARVLARRGRKVLAVDLDPNPGLAWSLGLAPTDAGLPRAAIERREGSPYGWGLATGIDAAAGAERFSIEAPDGVRYLSAGKIDGPDHHVTRSLAAARALVDAAHPSWDVLGDLEAGTTTVYEGYARFAHRMLVVVTPSWKSGLAARRLCRLFPDVPTTVVGTKFRQQPDHPGLEAQLRVPHDPEVEEAERRGMAPIDACPGSPVVAAVVRLADLLTGDEVPA